MEIEVRGIDDVAVAEQTIEAPEAKDEADELSVELPDEEEHKPAPDWVRKVRTDNRELRRELTRLKDQLNAQGNPQEEEVGAKPTLKDCDYNEVDFEKKLDDWKEKKRKADEAKAAREASARKADETWKGKLEGYGKAKAKLGAADFEDAEAVVLDVLNQTQQGIIVAGSIDPALVVYALGKNEAKARELAAITDPVEFAFAVARLEAQMKVNRNRPATAPEERVSGDRGAGAIGDSALERLRAEADKTGDYTKVNAYKRIHAR